MRKGNSCIKEKRGKVRFCTCKESHITLRPWEPRRPATLVNPLNHKNNHNEKLRQAKLIRPWCCRDFWANVLNHVMQWSSQHPCSFIGIMWHSEWFYAQILLARAIQCRVASGLYICRLCYPPVASRRASCLRDGGSHGNLF